MTSEINTRYEVVVVGGGAAGLSAAVTLSRALRSTLVIDAGEPRNCPAAAVHGFLSRDGVNPGELLAQGRKEVHRYGGQSPAGKWLLPAPLPTGSTWFWEMDERWRPGAC